MNSDVFIMYELSSGTGHSGSTAFETTSSYCRAKVEFNSIN